MCSGKELLFLVNVYKMSLKTHVLASHYFVWRPVCPGQVRGSGVCVLEHGCCASASLPLVRPMEPVTVHMFMYLHSLDRVSSMKPFPSVLSFFF